jgi:hypothetical protein
MHRNPQNGWPSVDRFILPQAGFRHLAAAISGREVPNSLPSRRWGNPPKKGLDLANTKQPVRCAPSDCRFENKSHGLLRLEPQRNIQLSYKAARFQNCERRQQQSECLKSQYARPTEKGSEHAAAAQHRENDRETRYRPHRQLLIEYQHLLCHSYDHRRDRSPGHGPGQQRDPSGP